MTAGAVAWLCCGMQRRERWEPPSSSELTVPFRKKSEKVLQPAGHSRPGPLGPWLNEMGVNCNTAVLKCMRSVTGCSRSAEFCCKAARGSPVAGCHRLHSVRTIHATALLHQVPPREPIQYNQRPVSVLWHAGWRGAGCVAGEQGRVPCQAHATRPPLETLTHLFVDQLAPRPPGLTILGRP